MKRPRTPFAKDSGRRLWYLLIHQIPPEPLYLRAKIRQRLSRVGAVALKNAVYVLPRREECLEDFQWIAEEAAAGGAEAYVCEAEFFEEETNATLIASFRAERDADYQALAEAIREWSRKAEHCVGANRPARDAQAAIARTRKRLDEIARIDFFDSPGRRIVEKQLCGLEEHPEDANTRTRRVSRRADWIGRTWATRRGIHIDRVASAWLIRRFLDRNARFRFVDPKEPPREGELRFDMIGGDFSHEADRCSFETLLVRAGLRDAALRQIAEIVHDIDLKDGKFGRPEARGIEQLINGLLLTHPKDETRLDRGFALFDELYRSFQGRNSLLQKEAGR